MCSTRSSSGIVPGAPETQPSKKGETITVGLWIAALASLALVVPGVAAEAASQPNLFDKENLVAWCMVPFDAARRGPEERAGDA
jgi:hypothetical protein